MQLPKKCSILHLSESLLPVYPVREKRKRHPTVSADNVGDNNGHWYKNYSDWSMYSQIKLKKKTCLSDTFHDRHDTGEVRTTGVGHA